MKIDRSLNGVSFLSSNRIWIEDDGAKPKFKATKRIGMIMPPRNTEQAVAVCYKINALEGAMNILNPKVPLALQELTDFAVCRSKLHDRGIPDHRNLCGGSNRE